MSGTLYGLGVGPGDPELLTLKAVRLIAASQVIAYPRLADRPSFARAIAAMHLTTAHVELPLAVPMGGHETAVAAAYDEGAAAIARHLEEGRDVAVLCEGDAFFYGSFAYLWRRLVGRFPCEVVPGVTSLTAAPVRLGLPLVTGNDCLAVMPAGLSDDALAAHLEVADAAAILKVGRHLPRLAALLGRLGLAARTRYIERATLPEERMGVLADFASKAPYFSMLLVARRGTGP